MAMIITRLVTVASIASPPVPGASSGPGQTPIERATHDGKNIPGNILPSVRMPACIRSIAAALSACLLLGLPADGTAHALLHEVLDGDAVTVRLSFPGGDQPLFEAYEVFAPGDSTPFQAGRVNAIGELSFRPDRAGAWRVRVFTEDGHGAMIDLGVDAAGRVAAVHEAHTHPGGYWLRALAALGYLLGLFGILVLWRQRRRGVDSP
jgi:nickel transport protein